MGDSLGCLSCGFSDTTTPVTSGSVCDNIQNMDFSGINWWWIGGAALLGFTIGRMSKRRYQRAK